MRTTFITFILVLGIIFNISACAASRIVDQVFNKYADKEGFTTVNVSPALLSLFGGDLKELGEFTSVKILAADEGFHSGKSDIDFSRELISKLKRDQYKELMTVKEKDQEVVMLVKENGKKISEFLMVVGGDDNVLISILGNFSIASLRKLGKNIKIDGLDKLADIDG